MIFLEKIAKQYFIVLPIIVVIVYLRLLSFGMTGFGDDLIIVNNYDRISNLTEILSEFSKPYPGDNDYKPLTMISYYLNASLAGQSTYFYHLTNIALHTFICVLLYKFMLLLGLSRVSSIVGAILFAVHPLIIGNLALIESRSILMMVAFGLLSLMFTTYYFNEHKSQKIWLSGLFLLLSILSDFSGFSIALIIIAYSFTFHNNDFKENFNIIIAPILSVIIIWFLLFMNVDFTNTVNQLKGDTNIISVAGVFFNKQMLLLIPEVAGKFILPWRISTLPFFSVWGMILGTVVIITVAILPYFVFKNSELLKKIIIFAYITLFFSVVFSAITLTNSSSNLYDYSGSSVYLATIAMIMLLSGILSEFSDKVFGKSFNIVLILIIAILSYVSFFNLGNYSSELTFWESANKINPENSALSSKLIDVYAAGDYEEKIISFSNSIEPKSPIFSDVLLKTSRFYYKKKNYQSAINSLENLRKVDSNNKSAIQLLVSSYYLNKDYNNAIEILKSYAKDTANFPEARWDLFNMYLENKRFDEAQLFAKESFNGDNDQIRALQMLESWSTIFFKENDNVAVVKTMKTALVIQPNNPVILNYLYDTYLKIGMKDKAREYEIRLKRFLMNKK